MFPPIQGEMTPFDVHIFQLGGSTTNWSDIPPILYLNRLVFSIHRRHDVNFYSIILWNPLDN